MKVLLIGKSDLKGGASIAAYRLFKSLEAYTDLNIAFLVERKYSGDKNVYSTCTRKWLRTFRFVWERLVFSFYEYSKEVRFKFSLANTGQDITKNPLFQEADVIHIHWFNNGFLSLSSLHKILNSGKPVIWTLHDMWAFTGGCHYSNDCTHFFNQCGNCPMLKNPSSTDLSYKLHREKSSILLNHNNLSFITCSYWLKEQALKSSLINEFKVDALPNTINTELFRPKNISEFRTYYNLPANKKYILFGAANISDSRKGFSFLLRALYQLSDYQDNIELLVFGKIKKNSLDNLPFYVHYLSYLHSFENIVNVYNAAHCFVLPSLEDNLPNTVLESLACGTPVVGFDTGGIPEMVEHKKNGYLARYQSVEDLAEGIAWTLFESNYSSLASFAREKVMNDFNQKRIAQLHEDLYNTVLDD